MYKSKISVKTRQKNYYKLLNAGYTYPLAKRYSLYSTSRINSMIKNKKAKKKSYRNAPYK